MPAGDEATRLRKRRALWAAAALLGLLLAGVAAWSTRGPLTPAEAAGRRKAALEARGWEGVEFQGPTRTGVA